MFSRLSNFHLFLAFISILALRLIVGFHFFNEGVAKLAENGEWTAEYFLKGAKGPLAEQFHAMADDADGRKQLCITKSGDKGNEKFTIDPSLTFGIWKDFVDRATGYYGFGSPDLESKLLAASENPGGDKDSAEYQIKSAEIEAKLRRLQQQPRAAQAALESHKIALEDWINANRIAVLAHYETESRLGGFDRDGESKEDVATWVASLREQVDSIRKDRTKALAGWKAEVGEIWDSFETQINNIAIEEQQRADGAIPLHRPHQQTNSKLSWINKIVPWFDTIVGALLIVGLFTRFSSIAAALFLLSVCLTQPFWVPGTDPTWFQAIEMFACVVLFAFCAGRFGGLDYFFSPGRNPESIPTSTS